MNNLQKVTREEEKEMVDLLKLYNYVYRCKDCNVIYGTDKLATKKQCRVCENISTKLKKERNKRGN